MLQNKYVPNIRQFIVVWGQERTCFVRSAGVLYLDHTFFLSFSPNEDFETLLLFFEKHFLFLHIFPKYFSKIYILMKNPLQLIAQKREYLSIKSRLLSQNNRMNCRRNIRVLEFQINYIIHKRDKMLYRHFAT